jgi:hypothetical protein
MLDHTTNHAPIRVSEAILLAFYRKNAEIASLRDGCLRLEYFSK